MENIEAVKIDIADVCSQHKGLVVKIARKFFLDYGDLDDLVQEGMIGLFKASLKYDSSKGAFSTFATLCIKSEIINAIRASTRHGNIDKVSIEQKKLEEILLDEKSCFDRLMHEMDGEERLKNIKLRLSVSENKVLCLYLDGFSYAQMAERLGTNTKSIENAIKRIKEKLKQK